MGKLTEEQTQALVETFEECLYQGEEGFVWEEMDPSGKRRSIQVNIKYYGI